jgi:hypothetical protein
MTPEEERALLDEIAQQIEERTAAAFDRYSRAVSSGEQPEAAARNAIEGFNAEAVSALAAGLSAVTAEDVSADSAGSLSVGARTVNEALSAEADEVAAVVGGIVSRHDEGFAALRAEIERAFAEYKG